MKKSFIVVSWMWSLPRMWIYLHAFYRDNDNLKLFSTTKMKLNKAARVAFIVGTCVRICKLSRPCFPWQHMLAQYDLVKKNGLTRELGLSSLVALIDSVVSHQQRYLQSSTQSQDDIDGKKARALNDIAFHAMKFVVAKSNQAPRLVLQRKTQQIRSALLRHRAALGAHKNILWRLWNSVVCLFKGVGFHSGVSWSSVNNANTKMAFFRSADTTSLGLARNCAVACS